MKARLLPLLAMLMFAGFASADEAGVAWEDLDENQQRVLNSFAES